MYFSSEENSSQTFWEQPCISMGKAGAMECTSHSTSASYTQRHSGAVTAASSHPAAAPCWAEPIPAGNWGTGAQPSAPEGQGKSSAGIKNSSPTGRVWLLPSASTQMQHILLSMDLVPQYIKPIKVCFNGSSLLELVSLIVFLMLDHWEGWKEQVHFLSLPQWSQWRFFPFLWLKNDLINLYRLKNDKSSSSLLGRKKPHMYEDKLLSLIHLTSH